MKTKIILILSLFAFNSIFAQDVKIKKNDVFLDDVSILKYERGTAISHSFFNLEGKEILLFNLVSNSSSVTGSTYILLNFLNEKVKIESSEVSRISAPMNMKRICEKLINWLLKEKVLNVDGTVNSEKLDLFYQKYNKNLSER